jgi:DNA-binding beta-propeller fold protein YncE
MSNRGSPARCFLRPRVPWALGAASLLWLFFATSALGGDRVYWANYGNDTISFANLDGSGGGGQLSTAGAPASGPHGVAIDPAAGRIYWANYGNNTIAFANLDGSGGGQLSTAGAPASGPTGVAINPAAGRIYWANSSNNTIAFANLDGSGGGQLSTAGATVSTPEGVAIDPATGRIYWPNAGNNTIAFANLDGSGGGGQLSTAGATVNVAEGVAIDPAAGRIYWANYHSNDTISFANLDGSGGGGQLSTAGAPASGPVGVAIDPAAGRIYWANFSNNTIGFANLDGSGGADLSIAGATARSSNSPALLKAPSGAGAPALAGGGQVGEQISCSQGSWAPDLLSSFLYRAPRSFTYQWRKDGSDIAGATQATYTPTSPGEYSCRVTATNQAGSTSQTSAPRTVSETPPPPEPTPTPIPTPTPTPTLEIIDLERDRANGTATLTVATDPGGALRVAKTRNVKPFGPVDLLEAGSAELQVVPRNRAAQILRRTGRVTVNPRVLFAPAVGGEIGERREFDLRQN